MAGRKSDCMRDGRVGREARRNDTMHTLRNTVRRLLFGPEKPNSIPFQDACQNPRFWN